MYYINCVIINLYLVSLFLDRFIILSIRDKFMLSHYYAPTFIIMYLIFLFKQKTYKNNIVLWIC